MKMSSKAQYGLRLCYILANNYPDTMLSASVLEKNIKVSSKYIEKILRILSKRNIVSANRGASGGYYLTRPPEKITAGEIVRALEDDFELAPCITSPCRKCASSAVWKKLYDGINGVLDSITLKSMIEDFNDTKSDSGCSCYKDNDANKLCE